MENQSSPGQHGPGADAAGVPRPSGTRSAADPGPVVGFVGAGSMGGPMVERLLAAGHTVHLFARRPAVAESLSALGATLEPSVAAVAARADTLILCPFSQDQLAEITDGPDGALRHLPSSAVLVQHATIAPSAIRELTARGRERGVEVLDAPINGTSDATRAGRLAVLIGGDEAAADRVEPLLRTYAATVLRTGDVGSASATKLINNLLFAAHVQTAIEAINLGASLGLEGTGLLNALAAGVGNSYVVELLRTVGDVEVFTEKALPYMRKDTALIVRLAADLGLDTGLLGEIVNTGPATLVAT
ncbi:NAD(P)-dependent oxidoreductase [Frankia sp. QA3]|uniref:NAD(P)-dependent oxidoreductase n=1 Tax=Frankia sp. QA3 TaxID=710111 RepID=UPI000269C052|nr:NAD(P)-dependent oxidoreductase [Frankia sp. QA3]EIV92007.1 beta-hydroxyacid dehydrogenase, 3-hydroxyisobutyrate dehydrogenase [Frankia sp. QA3]